MDEWHNFICNLQSKGWFGGVFSKLMSKSKNEMKLPDDKDPTVS